MGYGMDAELAAKAKEKYDPELENQAAEWIEAVTGESGVKGNFAEALKSGVVLCKVLNTIKPGTIKKINEQSMAFKQRENISNFLTAIQKLGVHNNAVFGPDDLYEAKNMGSVLNCLFAFGGAVQVSVPEYDGPKFGVADASHATQDVKRSGGPATQTGGLTGTLDKTSIDTSNDVARGAKGTSSASKPVPSSSPIRDGGEVEADAHGLDEDLKKKAADKYDHGLEDEAAEWIEAVTGESGIKGNFAEALHSGVVLCKLINTIKPGTIKKINENKMAFKQRENIGNFITAVQALGVHNSQVFGPDDLYDEKNMGSVVNCIFAFGGAVQVSVPEFEGPKFGVADNSAAKKDVKRNVGPATQTGGLAAAMEKTEVKVTGIVMDTGGATSLGGTAMTSAGSSNVMDRTHVDVGSGIVKDTGGAVSLGGTAMANAGSSEVMDRTVLDMSNDIDHGAKASS